MDALNHIFFDEEYREQLRVAAKTVPFQNASILVTGATGLIGSCLVDVLSLANKEHQFNTRIYALSRNKERLQARFSYDQSIVCLPQSVEEPIPVNVDFVFHFASLADPMSYALHPTETITTNIWGAKNVLDYCRETHAAAFLASSFEVYGNAGKDWYNEEDFGAINFNEVRSGYPESKRVVELLARCYAAEYNVTCFVGRLSSVYGPTMMSSDSKAHAQFLRSGINKQIIILKSKGEQRRTYCYVFDAVSAILTIVRRGISGRPYNIANSRSAVSIAEFAEVVSRIAGVSIKYEQPEELEKRGYSKPQNIMLNINRLEQLGWAGEYSLECGIKSTICIQKRLSSTRGDQ